MCTAHPVCDLEAVSRQAALRLIRLRPRKHSTQEAGRVGYATVRVPTRTSSMPLTEATEAPVRLRVSSPCQHCVCTLVHLARAEALRALAALVGAAAEEGADEELAWLGSGCVSGCVSG